jgi:hypothetical protein
MRIRHLIVLGILLQCPSAWAQDTLAAAIWSQYRVAPILPFAAFEHDSATAPLPGSTIGGVSERTLDGIFTYDLSGATICTSQNFDYPKFRGTQGFRQAFQAASAANRIELRVLFAFDDEALAAIRSYEVTISSARFLTIPFDQLLTVKTQTRDLGACSELRAATFRTAIKPIVANVDVVFQLTRPFSDETLKRLRVKPAIDLQQTERLEYRLVIYRKLIALGIAD